MGDIGGGRALWGERAITGTRAGEVSGRELTVITRAVWLGGTAVIYLVTYPITGGRDVPSRPSI